MISDTVLKFLSQSVANDCLSTPDKRRWVSLHNASANHYFVNSFGVIEKVSPSGWWY